MPPKRKGANRDLPARMHFSDGAHYYVTTGKPRRWINLGKDKAAALLEWARLDGAAPPSDAVTFAAAWTRYEREALPLKATRTQSDNRKEAKYLLAVFGAMAVGDIEPQHVRQYLSARGEVAKIRANREKALLSHIFNHAREWGMTTAPNPCAGVKGHKESGRDRYVEDAEYLAIWQMAEPPLRDAMDIALLTGQRPADVLKITRPDIRDGFLWLRQNKTGKRMRITIEGELADVLKRCAERTSAYPVSCLHVVQTERGQPLNYWTLRAMFDRARKAAGVNFQFRDIRAKSGSDSEDLARAQQLLGHDSRKMTEHYVRARAGDKVRPLR